MIIAVSPLLWSPVFFLIELPEEEAVNIREAGKQEIKKSHNK